MFKPYPQLPTSLHPSLPILGNGKPILPVVQAPNPEFILFFSPIPLLFKKLLLQDFCTCYSLLKMLSLQLSTRFTPSLLLDLCSKFTFREAFPDHPIIQIKHSHFLSLL